MTKVLQGGSTPAPSPDAVLGARIKRLGIKYPLDTIEAARYAGLPIPLACSILMQETAGGVNEFGHDPTICCGWGQVTRLKYLAYRARRRLTGKCQGVGPCQLTSAGLQNDADRLGGCWKPLPNMKVGFKFLADMIRRDGLRPAVTAYNGSGPAAEAYAQTVLNRANAYAHELGLPGSY